VRRGKTAQTQCPRRGAQKMLGAASLQPAAQPLFWTNGEAQGQAGNQLKNLKVFTQGLGSPNHNYDVCVIQMQKWQALRHGAWREKCSAAPRTRQNAEVGLQPVGKPFSRSWNCAIQNRKSMKNVKVWLSF
jgi:hypothetical protein